MAAPIVVGSQGGQSTSSFLGINHTPVTSSQGDRAFFFALASRGNSSADTNYTTLTYNAVPLVPVANITTGGFSVRTALYYLPDALLPPDNGGAPYFFNVSTFNAQQVAATIIEITGVDQSVPVNSQVSANISQQFSWSTNISTLTPDVLLLDSMAGDFSGNMTPDPGQTEEHDVSPANLTHGSSHKTVLTPQATAMGWSFSTGSNRTAHCIAELIPFASGAQLRPALPGFFF